MAPRDDGSAHRPPLEREPMHRRHDEPAAVQKERRGQLRSALPARLLKTRRLLGAGRCDHRPRRSAPEEEVMSEPKIKPSLRGSGFYAPKDREKCNFTLLIEELPKLPNRLLKRHWRTVQTERDR